MLGAIVGDIVGSVYEWNNIKTKDFPLFSDKCFFTDDTVMTIAVADALLNGGTADDFIDSMKKYGELYPDAGYGGGFRRWLFSDDREPYNSWGNGSAMRVSPCGWYANSLDEAETLAERSAAVTHNHPEGIKGAQATVVAIYLALEGKSKAEIKEYIERKYEYDLNRTLDDIRPIYRFNESCQKTVPEAIIAFLESTDFEDAIRNAISLGGDSDTLAAITGSIAEAYYSMPDDIREKALSYLDNNLRAVYSEWELFAAPKSNDCISDIHFENKDAWRDTYNALIKEVADECVSSMKETDRTYIRMHPDTNRYHFGYGMYIRNKYRERFRSYCSDDGMSSDVLREIVIILVPEYKDIPLYYKELTKGGVFNQLHSNFLTRYDCCPVAIATKYYKYLLEIDACKGSSPDEIYREFYNALAEEYWDFTNLRKRALSMEIPEPIIEEYYECCKNGIKNYILVPSSLLLLYKDELLSDEERKGISLEISAFMGDNLPSQKKESYLPNWLFSKRIFVEISVKENGELLSLAPDYADDYDIVSSAVSDSAASIKYASERMKKNRKIIKQAVKSDKCSLVFTIDVLRDYNDDEEIVRLALKSNGANIAYASDRFKNDYEFAKIALNHIGNYYPDTAYRSLSSEFRNDKELALIMIKKGVSIPIDAMSECLRDDDDIADLLCKKDGKDYYLSKMSLRIQEAYGYKPKRKKNNYSATSME